MWAWLLPDQQEYFEVPLFALQCIETTLSTNSPRVQLPGVNITASSDGRLVAVCTIDGSLSWHDDGYSLLVSVIEGAPHVVSNVSDSPSSSRAKAAAEAGPICSFQLFFPKDTYYCWQIMDKKD
jgi:hypothetical protein